MPHSRCVCHSCDKGTARGLENDRTAALGSPSCIFCNNSCFQQALLIGPDEHIPPHEWNTPYLGLLTEQVALRIDPWSLIPENCWTRITSKHYSRQQSSTPASLNRATPSPRYMNLAPTKIPTVPFPALRLVMSSTLLLVCRTKLVDKTSSHGVAVSRLFSMLHDPGPVQQYQTLARAPHPSVVAIQKGIA